MSANLKTIITLASVLLLQACSGGSGGGGSDRQQDPSGTTVTPAFIYSGPAPADTEIQSFKIEFYDNLVAEDRCGSCHSVGGVGGLAFVDRDDVNNAWQNARTVANLNDPGASAIVAKVAGGHQCWQGAASAQSCAQLVETWITNWASSLNGGATEINLQPRTIRVPVPTKVFPNNFVTVRDTLGLDLSSPGELLDILRNNCATCHSDTSSVRQAPFFASSDDEIAYAAAITKIDLINTEDSRLVVRLRDEAHNCFGNCATSAQTIQDAIDRLEIAIPAPPPFDPNLVISMAQILDSDGISVSVGGRIEENIIAKWEFGEGSGTTAVDTSGVAPAIFLRLSGEYEWLGIGGIRFEGGKAQASVVESQKIRNKLTASGEYTIEAWVTPFNVVQEETSIVSYSGGATIRNFMLGQTQYNYDFYNRGSATNNDGGGEPVLSTADGDEIAQAALQHVVITFDAINGRRIYVNGQFTNVNDPQGGGNLATWNDSFALVLGNDASGNNPWSGNLRMVAVHNRALSLAQIQQNFDAGVGQVFYLLFSVSETIDEVNVCHEGVGVDRINYCYVIFEVSQLDSYSYLFSDPSFLTLNDNAFPADFDIRGLRLGMNGKIVDVGQSFIHSIDTTVNNAGYTAIPAEQIGLRLVDSNFGGSGTIIPVQSGPALDAFFLAFERLATENGVTTPVPAYAFSYSNPTVAAADAAPDIGVRTFDEINDAFAAITTVPTDDVRSVYNSIRRSMPSIADFQAYFSSHQMAITQLAIAYCDVLVEDNAKRTAFFVDDAGPTAFTFNQQADVVSDAEWTDQVIDPLLEAVLVFNNAPGDPLNLPSQPDVLDIDDAVVDDDGTAEQLLLLITDTRDLKPYVYDSVNDEYDSAPDGIPDGLAECVGACTIARTAEVVKAACATVLGSAAVTLQ
jgi:mono/diheme cytochrome c family protein